MSLSFHGICLIYIWSLAIWKTEGSLGWGDTAQRRFVVILWIPSQSEHCLSDSPWQWQWQPWLNSWSWWWLCHRDFGNIVAIATHWLDSTALPSSEYSQVVFWPNFHDDNLQLLYFTAVWNCRTSIKSPNTFFSFTLQVITEWSFQIRYYISLDLKWLQT